MKKFIFLLVVVFAAGFYDGKAQVGVTINIGSQPVWGPVGYDYAEYYYFPETDVYYHVPDRQFIYFDRGNWTSAYSLPLYFRNFDLYRSYKVVVNEPRPYMRNDFWHSRYYSYRGRQQEIIYNSREPKYYVINEHPEHSRWIAARSNNDRGSNNNNRSDNYGRPDPGRSGERFNNNRRPYDVATNDRDRNDRFKNDNYSGNENRRSNQNNQGNNDNGRFNGSRRY